MNPEGKKMNNSRSSSSSDSESTTPPMDASSPHDSVKNASTQQGSSKGVERGTEAPGLNYCHKATQTELGTSSMAVQVDQEGLVQNLFQGLLDLIHAVQEGMHQVERDYEELEQMEINEGGPEQVQADEEGPEQVEIDEEEPEQVEADEEEPEHFEVAEQFEADEEGPEQIVEDDEIPEEFPDESDSDAWSYDEEEAGNIIETPATQGRRSRPCEVCEARLTMHRDAWLCYACAAFIRVRKTAFITHSQARFGIPLFPECGHVELNWAACELCRVRKYIAAHKRHHMYRNNILQLALPEYVPREAPLPENAVGEAGQE